MCPKRHTTLASIPRPVLFDIFGNETALAVVEYYRCHPLAKKLTPSKGVGERTDAKQRTLLGEEMEFITVSLKNWKRYNPRGDVKKPSWFRLDCSLIDDPEFYSFTAEEFKAWIYILSMCCRKNKGTIQLFLGHAENSCRISKKALFSAVKKLSELGILTVIASVDVTRLPAADTPTNATNERTDERNERDETNTQQAPFGFDLESAYQAYPRKLGKAAGMKSLTKQIKTQAEFDDFLKAVSNYAKAMTGTEEKFIKHFSSFVGTEKSGTPWREFVEYRPTAFNKAQAQSDANVEVLKAYARKLGVT